MTPGFTRGLLDFIYPEPRRVRYKICKVSSAAADSDYHYISHTPGFTGGHRCIDPSDLAFIRYTKTIFSIMDEIQMG